MLFFDEVMELTNNGGFWGCGYLCAVDSIVSDDWFFCGYFKNDPCMFGILMFEGCFQVMVVYLVSWGYMFEWDGWWFEFVFGVEYDLKCCG